MSFNDNEVNLTRYIFSDSYILGDYQKQNDVWKSSHYLSFQYCYVDRIYNDSIDSYYITLLHNCNTNHQYTWYKLS